MSDPDLHCGGSSRRPCIPAGRRIAPTGIAHGDVPVLHVIAGPNGAGKSTFAQAVLLPVTHLPFINADEIAALTWPGQEVEHAYDASAAAAVARDDALSHRQSFITETVFSHPSKIELVRQGVSAGYVVTLHVILVPEEKLRERYRRLWDLVAEAHGLAHRAIFYDNSRASSPFLPVAAFENGRLVGDPAWPAWTPAAIAGCS